MIFIDFCDLKDMRKALKRDIKQESIIPLNKPITADDLEW